MTLVKFDPFRGFESFNRRMNKFVNEFEKGFVFETGGFAPRVDIIEDDKKIFVAVELPGVAKEDVKISINEDRVMTISGEKKPDEMKEGVSQIKIERGYGKFQRAFVLPENIDESGVNAKFENGVLEVSVAKKEPEKPKEIEVSIA